jgi:hypothetical protein
MDRMLGAFDVVGFQVWHGHNHDFSLQRKEQNRSRDAIANANGTYSVVTVMEHWIVVAGSDVENVFAMGLYKLANDRFEVSP